MASKRKESNGNGKGGNGHDIGLRLFVQQTMSVPPLQPKEEMRLVGLAGAGDPAAKRTVVHANLSLVPRVLEDEGLLDYSDPRTTGLMETGSRALEVAIKTFNRRQHGSFQKHAMAAIKEAVEKEADAVSALA